MAKLLPNQLAICLFACLLTGGLLMQTGCVGALSQLIYTIRGHDEEPAFPGLNDKRVAVVCVSDASAYGPDTLTYTVAQAVGIQLANGLDDGSRIVAPSKIEEWIDDNGWNETEYVELGRGVEADMVVAVKYLRDTHKPGVTKKVSGSFLVVSWVARPKSDSQNTNGLDFRRRL